VQPHGKVDNGYVPDIDSNYQPLRTKLSVIGQD